MLIPGWLAFPDAVVGALLAPLALAILISGFDDLFVDAVRAASYFRSRFGKRAPEPPPAAIQKRIAIFVPLWREHAVIGRMLEHNIAAIDYDNYEFFVGAYPNDELTLNAVREIESRYPHVHLAVCPHDGPTSKADCLNWIYQRMLLHCELRGLQFDVVVTHDAEDLIDPGALKILNNYADRFGMVQIPVLPLPTPWWDVVHGVYCDEFAEFQLKDMPARQAMGSFIPSSGVGTGYTRAAMENMATSAGNRVFEPECLTEDYENGMRLHALGCSQAFVPLRANARRAVITREYFPRTLRAAIRQRTRWITGIALQSWERHGWNGNAADGYWFWRDRKGLLGNPLSLASNLVFLYGAATSLWAPVARLTHLLDRRVAVATLALLIYRTAIRIFCVGRMYGWVFAAGAPLRCVCANFINSVAGMRALVQFARAKILREPLVWLKTDHGYPSRAALLEHKRTLADILTSSGYLDQHRLRKALDMKPADMNLGDYLVSQHVLSAEQLLHALSLQHGLPAGPVLPEEVSPAAARTLPRHVVRSWRVLPYRIVAGSLHVATPDTPSDEMTRELRGFTALEMRFQLVTSENFERLLELLQ